MNIRVAEVADVPELAVLYRQTVLTHGPQHYTPEQTRAWAASAAVTDSFRAFILGVTTYVAEDDTGLVGFAGIGTDGHIASIYVRCDRLRQGIGAILMQTLLDHAQHHRLPRLYAEASEFSLGLFQRFGFQCYDTERVTRQGIKFRRYLMEKI